jgi:hypothetical protein
MRREHGLTMLLAMASATALLAACGAGSGDQARSPATTSETPTATPTPSRTDVDLRKVPGTTLDLSAMRTGAPPAIPWIEGRTLHLDRADLAIRPRFGAREDVPVVIAFGGGYLRYDDPSGRAGTHLDQIRADGTVAGSTFATAPVVSWDGRHVAWWEPPTHAFVIGDAVTGTLENLPAVGPWAFFTSNHPGDPWNVSVVGWLADGELLVRGPSSRDAPEGIWRTSGRTVPAWTAQRFSGLSTEAGIALVEDFPYTDPTEVDANCLSAVDLETSARVWRHCYRLGDQPYPAETPVFSPDGTRLAVAAISISTGEPGYELVLDAASGDVLARFDLGRYEGDQSGFETELSTPWFEDDDHLLAVADQRRHDATGAPTTTADEAIVRCDVRGGCELATPVVAHDQATGGAPPYRLR